MKKFVTRCAALALGAVMTTGCVGTLENPYSGHLDSADPLHDQIVGTDPSGDLDLWGVRYSPTVVEMWMKPGLVGDPRMDTNWTDTTLGTMVEWYVDTDNDEYINFLVTGFLLDDLTYLVVVESETGVTCTGTGEYNGAKEIALRLDPVACFGGQGPIRVSLALGYETPSELTLDEAPPYPVWSGWIVPSATP